MAVGEQLVQRRNCDRAPYELGEWRRSRWPACYELPSADVVAPRLAFVSMFHLGLASEASNRRRSATENVWNAEDAAT